MDEDISPKLHQEFVEKLKDPVIYFDRTGKIRFYNLGAQILFGYTREEAIGQGVEILMPETLRESHKKLFLNFVEKGKGGLIGERREIPGQTKAGKIFPITVGVTPFAGEPPQLFGTLSVDMTKNRELTQKLENSMKGLEDRLSIMSHEFNTPITAIIGSVGILKSINRALSDDEKKFLEIINKNAQTLTKTVEKFLTDSKYLSGNYSFDLEAQPFGDFFLNLVPFSDITLEKENKQDKIKIEYKLPNNFEKILLHTDSKLLEVILHSLISNAIKYTNSGNIEIGAIPVNDNMLRFYVSDTGIGISPENHELIFELYKKVAEDSGINKGTGTGLTIARKLAKDLGTNITLESKLGEGTTMKFDILYSVS